MDINLYYEILKWREEDPSRIDTNANPPQPIGVSIFHQDILLNKAVWTNRKRKDFRYWLSSWHPAFGLLSAPQNHPYSKKYRLANISFILSIGALWSVFSWYCVDVLFDISSHGDFPKLMLISVVNCILMGFIEWVFVKRQCIKQCFKLIISIPGSILVVLTIIAILGSAVIAAEILFDILPYLFIFCMTFILLWSFQLLLCYLSFGKQWNFDHRLIDADQQRDSLTNEDNDDNDDNQDNKKRIQLGGQSMVPYSQKNPYYVTYRDYQEFIAQRGVDNMDISISNDDQHSNNPVLGYQPPNVGQDDDDDRQELLSNGDNALL